MGAVRVCHKCYEYVIVGETFAAQKVLRAFEKDHRADPLGNADSAEVRSYTNVTAKYAPEPEEK